MYKIFTKNKDEIFMAVLHEDTTILYVSYNYHLKFRTIMENINPEIWLSFYLYRKTDCGIIEVFKDFLGIIIVSVEENNKIVNKISYNGGFRWINMNISVLNDKDHCLEVILHLSRNIVILNFRRNACQIIHRL